MPGNGYEGSAWLLTEQMRVSSIGVTQSTASTDFRSSKRLADYDFVAPSFLLVDN